MTDVYISNPIVKVKEGSFFIATAYFRSDAGAALAPTTAKYRVDCLTTGKELKAWTSLTPATSINIGILPAWNAIQWQSNRREKKQLIVASDPDTTTQVRDKITWIVDNIDNVS